MAYRKITDIRDTIGMRAVFYARVSTAEEEQLNAIELQIEENRGCIKDHGWKLVGEYIDRSKSGTMVKGRDDYQRLYEDLYEDLFDIVVIKYNNEKIIKRVIGLPGDYIEYKDNILYVNGKEIKEEYKRDITNNFSLKDLGYEKIPENKYLVLGDNRSISKDSRIIGLIDKEDIEGYTGIIVFPFKRIGNVIE